LGTRCGLRFGSSPSASRSGSSRTASLRCGRKTRRLDDGRDIKEINPKGFVPVLELDDGQRLTEVAAVLQYVADRVPERGLAPPFGSFARYRLIEWLSFIGMEIHKIYWPLFHEGAEIGDLVTPRPWRTRYAAPVPRVESEAAIEDVADTALWIAAYRARETARADALFRDPLAARLAGPKGARVAATMTGAEQFYWMTTIRTVVIDELLIEAVTRGAGMVLNLGAGLDTRPYRLALPSTLRWIEVDVPKIVARKDELLRDERPKCDLERVAADLSDAVARRALFARLGEVGQDVVILTEGVLAYLTENEVAALADDLRAHSRFRTWIADHSARFLTRTVRARVQRSHLKNAPMRFQPENWQEFFRAHGWRAAEMRYLPIEGERLGRPLALPWWFVPVHAVLPRRARKAIRRMMGYARLEPT
jgi:methyltransferase (TIGR00027 family)